MRAHIVLAALLACSTLVPQPVSVNGLKLDLRGVVATSARHEGRPAVRLIEADATRAGGYAVLAGETFTDGTIEVDVAGRRSQYAKPDDRGFVGIAFRIGGVPEKHEVFYLRPDNARAADQLRRNHTTQYASYPDYPWELLRKEFPGKYESYVDLEMGAWTRMRIDVSGRSARLFVHGASQPQLIVDDLRLPPAAGGIGLWIGSGAEAFFANLRITRR